MMIARRGASAPARPVSAAGAASRAPSATRMKRRTARAIRFALCPIILAVGCTMIAGKLEAPGIAARATAAHETEIEAHLRALSPADKVGQLLMIGVDGAELTPETAAAIHRIRPGGVILFRKNVRTAAQVAAFTNARQRESRAAGGLPLLIATDQEGGTVSQVAVITEFPDPMALAAAGSERLVERVARANGDELRALGISVNLAPVLDVNSNPRNPVIGIRSFGNTPESVARFGRACIRGLHAAGVIAVAKHFPGHGATDTDTHFDAVRVDASEATLAQTDLVPFQAAVGEGVDMIMPAHLTVPALSGSDTGPVTFSRSALTTFLRARMGFRGVVITDSLQMAAALQGPFAESCVSAVRAGADILLLPGNLPGPDPRRPPDAAGATRIETAYQALLASLTSGRADALQPGEVDAAVRRILLVKKGLHASFAVTDWAVDE